jgi:hypothetical protein
MAIIDVEVVETGNGGDLRLVGRDLALVAGWDNMPYLGMFGGNVGQSTPTNRVEGEEGFDWWGNSLLFGDTPELQFNSLTEARLNAVTLTSSGRSDVEQAILRDLSFMRPFAEVTVTTEITGIDRLRISIIVKRPESLQQQVYIYLWDGVTGTLNFVPSNQGDYNNDYNNDYFT